MKSELIVDVTPHEVAIALTEDDRLMEVNREQRGKDTFAVGNIYYGRVKKIMPALNAAFVDVGHEKEAFLHYLDLGSGFLTTQKYVSKLVSDRRRIPEIHKIERRLSESGRHLAGASDQRAHQLERTTPERRDIDHGT